MDLSAEPAVLGVQLAVVIESERAPRFGCRWFGPTHGGLTALGRGNAVLPILVNGPASWPLRAISCVGPFDAARP